MLFISSEFILYFLPITVALYYLLGGLRRRHSALLFLVVASLFFYSWWNPAYLALILFSIVFNYVIGQWMGRLEGGHKKRILILGVVANLGLLGYYKYANFFVDNINAVLDLGFNLERIILPLAISFFTFQQISYLADTYKGKTDEHSFMHYCLYVSFFPQLIAGPIVHHSEMMPQFRDREFVMDWALFAAGLGLFIAGVFKKIALADQVAEYVDKAFSQAQAGEVIPIVDAWLAPLAHMFQLYYDFSGYSDMAIGLALMFGIWLPRNFDSPLKSHSLVHFWDTWHVTLSRFLRDYVYIPLGGSRKGEVRRYSNLLATMTVGGLWHGAAWAFVVWGALHGVFLIANQLWRRWLVYKKINIWRGRVVSVFSYLLTMASVLIADVFFRAADFSVAMAMLGHMFTLGDSWVSPSLYFTLCHVRFGLGAEDGNVWMQSLYWMDTYKFIIFLFVVIKFMPNAHNVLLPANRPSLSLPRAFWVAAMAAAAFVGSNVVEESPFLYFNF